MKLFLKYQNIYKSENTNIKGNGPQTQSTETTSTHSKRGEKMHKQMCLTGS